MQPMQLINTSSGAVIATIRDNTLDIKESTLRSKIQTSGIQIPAYLQEVYGGKARVGLEDTKFVVQAFKDVYSKSMGGIFKWYKLPT